MHKSESVLENETYEILCDFEIQTDPLIYSGLCRSGRPQSKNNREKKRTKKEKKRDETLTEN